VLSAQVVVTLGVQPSLGQKLAKKDGRWEGDTEQGRQREEFDGG